MPQLTPHFRKVVLFLLPPVWLGVAFLVFNLTSPLRVGPAGILLVFVLFYALASSLFYLLLKIAAKIIKKFLHKEIMADRQQYYIACVIAFGPIFFVALNTLGQLGLVEVALVLTLISLATFYVLRRSSTQL